MRLIRTISGGYGKRAEFLFVADNEHEDVLLLDLRRGSESAVVVEVTLGGEKHQALKLSARNVARTVLSYVVSLIFCGLQKIPVIKLVRELTNLGLKEAKDLVETGGEVARRKTEKEAEDVARRFRETGSTVVIFAEYSDEEG